MAWVIVGHTFFHTIFLPTTNPSYREEVINLKNIKYQYFYQWFVHKWCHAVFDNFEHPLPHRHAF